MNDRYWIGVMINDITILKVKLNKKMQKLSDMTILNRILEEILKNEIRKLHNILLIMFINMLLE